MAKIVSVVITPSDRKVSRYEAEVHATMEDGSTNVPVFKFFDDELSFTPDEFVGKTIAEAREMKRRKDIEYLQSPS